ncbi:ABC transporter ATP-binding protein [Lysinibacillus endophyticus]|uniref:ABC transporter ATP-binding protein n=1 Tax=Ureibacillus endophyticus TaxID=1978490 RepID=A0A494Z8N8_9BACL|nr:ABC transporter ATP-binding protein [Lysinibacillus endophyticus]MCP1143348.1 ABC transporter ATP-binding protein/permease [Lysinibacillus endophyticus]RKQ18900.1 ABC transporter ATP-binding protein [Lysinibacillus endophyticus]
MLSKFFSYYKPHKRLFIIDFASAIIVAILELAFPIAVQWFIDELLPTNEWNTIVKVSILLLLVYVLSTILNFIVNYLGHKLGINIETDMRQDLFNHFQKQSFRFFDNNKTGHLMSRITNDLFDIGEFAHHGPEDFFIAVMTFIGAFAIMFNVNPTLAYVALVAVPLLIALVTFSNKKMNAAWKEMYGKIADVNGRVEDSVAGIRVVQSFTNEQFEMERFREQNGFFRAAKLYAYKVMAGTHSGIYMMTRLLTLVVLVVGAWLSFNGKLSYGELVSFVLYTNVLIKPIDKISALLELYPKGMAGFKRFQDMLNEQPEVQDRPNAIDVPYLQGDITFENVNFNYEKDKTILKDISFELKAGEMTAFVGPSGAGKTTICSLIPRFYDVDSGSIKIDGIDIRDITKRSLREQIGIVQQDVFLFTGTIRENIAYGKRGATEEEIRDALKKAHLEDFVNNLPEGLETQIGERGLKLSGGQKQRLAIARMFLKNPPILILDEATSALDTETERIIQESLSELAENRTTLVIAHRLATIKDADRVLVITPNGIEEDGSYNELIQENGIFARLHQYQYN